MRKSASRTAARYRAAVFLLSLGILLPSVAPRGGGRIPPRIEGLLRETLAGEEDLERIAFVHTACILTERVDYFWGGKSRRLGWDMAWGWPRQVTSPGSETTGHIRSYGLDYSGLVSWAAATALEDPDTYDQVGEGTGEQFRRCDPVIDPRPGDLAFFSDHSHVGIVLGRDREGVVWVVHCSSTLGGVVVTPAGYGFALYGTPPIFSKKSLWDFPIDKKIPLSYTFNS